MGRKAGISPSKVWHKKCERCGEEFDAKSAHAKHCVTCRKELNNERSSIYKRKNKEQANEMRKLEKMIAENRASAKTRMGALDAAVHAANVLHMTYGKLTLIECRKCGDKTCQTHGICRLILSASAETDTEN